MVVKPKGVPVQHGIPSDGELILSWVTLGVALSSPNCWTDWLRKKRYTLHGKLMCHNNQGKVLSVWHFTRRETITRWNSWTPNESGVKLSKYELIYCANFLPIVIFDHRLFTTTCWQIGVLYFHLGNIAYVRSISFLA